MAEAAGWVVTGQSGANTPFEVVKTKPLNAIGQHIVYGIDASFSGTPAAAVLVQLVDPDISPNTVIWEGYMAAAGFNRVEFPRGITIPAGHQVAILVGAGGSGVKATASIHGTTR